MDRGPEWRSFDDEESDRERTGAPLTRSRHDRGLSTEIGNRGDSLRLSGRKRRRVARWRRQHNRARIASKAERNQVYAFTEIRRLVDALELPESVREAACVLFESAQDADLLRGRSLEGFAAAAVYATCRTRSISRTIDEVVGHARATRDELTVAYDALNRELGLPTGPIDPREYIPRFASRLELSPGTERRAAELADRAREAGVDVVTERRQGVPHREIVDYAEAEDVDLIAMGTHGRTGRDRLASLGSVTERVLGAADVPVLVVDIAGDDGD